MGRQSNDSRPTRVSTLTLFTHRLATLTAALLVANTPVAAASLDKLEAELTRLQQRLEALQHANPRIAPAAAVETGSKPRSWKLPGTNTSMHIGGYIKLDLIYDINASAGDSLGGTAIPIDGTAAGNRQGHWRLHARQSRFYVKTWTPTDWGEMATYISGDFFGAGGNQLISNSHGLRLRQAYGHLGPFLAGQTGSNFSAGEGDPEILDFDGPPGVITNRQAQIRYTHDFGGGATLALAIENPETGLIISVNPGSAAGLGLGPSHDTLPDFTFRLRHRRSRSSASFSGVFRRLNVDNGGGISASAFGWGLTAGVGWRFNKGRTAIGGTVYGGMGIGRYTTMAFTSAVYNGTGTVNQSLNTVPVIGGQVWLNHAWNSMIRTNVGYGRAYANVQHANRSALGGKNGLGAYSQDIWRVWANLIWSPVDNAQIGIEYMYNFRGEANSANGKAHRLQASFKYSF